MNKKCLRCRKQLKNKKQIEVGYGKVCYKKIQQKQQSSLLKRERSFRMKKIFVCSPFRGDIQGNQLLAEQYCKYVCNQGHAPFAPHLLFTRFLNDSIDFERRLGIEAGMTFLKCCDEIYVFCKKGEESLGMKAEIKYAIENNIPIKYIDIMLVNGQREKGVKND